MRRNGAEKTEQKRVRWTEENSRYLECVNVVVVFFSLFFFLSPFLQANIPHATILFSYNRVCGFLSFLFIICPGKADNRLAVISGVINLDDDNRRKTCAVCEAGGTLPQHQHAPESRYTDLAPPRNQSRRARPARVCAWVRVYTSTRLVYRDVLCCSVVFVIRSQT